MGKGRSVYHVTHGKDSWRVLKEGNERATVTTPTKQEAVGKAKELAKAQPLGQVKIHKQDGTIQTEYTYEKDPRETKG